LSESDDGFKGRCKERQMVLRVRQTAIEEAKYH